MGTLDVITPEHFDVVAFVETVVGVELIDGNAFQVFDVGKLRGVVLVVVDHVPRAEKLSGWIGASEYRQTHE